MWPASLLAVLAVAVFSIQAFDARELREVNAAVGAKLAAIPIATKPAATEVKASTREVAGGTKSGVLPAVVAAVEAARLEADIPSVLDPPIRKLFSDRYQYPAGCTADSQGETRSKICRIGDAASAKLIVAVGDSHLQMWMPAILKMALKDGWAVVPLGKSGCTPDRWRVTSGEHAQCGAWNKWVARQVKSLRPDVLLLGVAYTGLGDGGSRLALQSIFSLITTSKKFSKSTVVIEDDPRQTRLPTDCLLARDATMASCTSPLTGGGLVVTSTLAGQATGEGFSLLPTRQWFCLDEQCPMVIGNTIAYTDLDHISPTYALQLAEPFRAAFRRAVPRQVANSGASR